MIGGVLLAAGAGTRFRAAGGDIKLLARVDGRPLVERALAALAAAPLGDRVIVLGAHAAELMGWSDRVGSITAGKYADLVAVEGDPLAEPARLEQPRFVMKAGAVVRREALR